MLHPAFSFKIMLVCLLLAPCSPPPWFTTATSANDNFISTIWCPSLTQQSKLPSWSSSLICIKKSCLCVVQWFNYWWTWGASPVLLWTLSLTFWVLTLLMMDPQEFSIVLSITSAVALTAGGYCHPRGIEWLQAYLSFYFILKLF